MSFAQDTLGQKARERIATVKGRPGAGTEAGKNTWCEPEKSEFGQLQPRKMKMGRKEGHVGAASGVRVQETVRKHLGVRTEGLTLLNPWVVTAF